MFRPISFFMFVGFILLVGGLLFEHTLMVLQGVAFFVIGIALLIQEI